MKNLTPEIICKEHYAGDLELVPAKEYHTLLPTDLIPWYCYIKGRGHSILALIDELYDQNNPNLCEELYPVSVKAVLKKYEIKFGYPFVPLNYDDDIGLIVSAALDEF